MVICPWQWVRSLTGLGSGLYADVVQEVDWSVGEILAAREKNNLDKDTTRHLHFRQWSSALLRRTRSSAGPFRRKGTSWKAASACPLPNGLGIYQPAGR